MNDDFEENYSHDNDFDYETENDNIILCFESCSDASAVSFDGLAMYDIESTLKVKKMLEELDDQLYDEDIKNNDSVDNEKDIREGGEEEIETTKNRGGELDWRGNNNMLERRHNFETHNRPQLLHMEPRCEEWTNQFPHFRIVGKQIVTPLQGDILPTYNPEDTCKSRFQQVTASDNIVSKIASGMGFMSLDINGKGISLETGKALVTQFGTLHDEILAIDGSVEECFAQHYDKDENNIISRKKRELNLVGIPPLSPKDFFKHSIMTEIIASLWTRIVPELVPLLWSAINSVMPTFEEVPVAMPTVHYPGSKESEFKTGFPIRHELTKRRSTITKKHNKQSGGNSGGQRFGIKGVKLDGINNNITTTVTTSSSSTTITTVIKDPPNLMPLAPVLVNNMRNVDPPLNSNNKIPKNGNYKVRASSAKKWKQKKIPLNNKESLTLEDGEGYFADGKNDVIEMMTPHITNIDFNASIPSIPSQSLMLPPITQVSRLISSHANSLDLANRMGNNNFNSSSISSSNIDSIMNSFHLPNVYNNTISESDDGKLFNKLIKNDNSISMHKNADGSIVPRYFMDFKNTSTISFLSPRRRKRIGSSKKRSNNNFGLDLSRYKSI